MQNIFYTRSKRMISHKLKYLFIHIPKTAGSALALFLEDSLANEVTVGYSNQTGKDQNVYAACEINEDKKSIKHEPHEYFQGLYGDRLDDYFKFTIVRNPYDRMMSYHFWGSNTEYRNFTKEGFIRRVVELGEDPWSYQHKYINDDYHIIHYENLVEELKEIECLKQYDFDQLPKINVNRARQATPTLLYEDLYDEEMKSLVYDYYKKEFESFGYHK